MIDDFPDPEDRKAFVDRQLARLVPTPKPKAKPASKIETIFPNDFIFTEGHWPVSRALAAQMHWTAGDDARGAVGGDD